MSPAADFPGEEIERLIPARVRSILDDLKKTPIEYWKWLYASPNTEIYQGDILRKVSVQVMGPDGTVLSRECPVVVLSHTCDCQENQADFVAVAPFFSFQEASEDDQFDAAELDTFRQDMRANRLKDKFFLPRVGDLPDGWLDFNQVFSISSQYFHSENFKGARERIASLSAKGHYFFLMRLSFSVGRPDPTDSKRT